MSPIHIIKREKKAEAVQLRQKALEPLQRHCYILDKEVTILVEYTDYKGPRFKGEEGAIYCENIVNCYQNGVKCRYSGISPLYADPFYPREKPGLPEEEASEEPPEDEDPVAPPVPEPPAADDEPSAMHRVGA